MNQKKQLAANTVIIAIGKLSTQIISFLLLKLYTSRLSTAEYGIYDFIVTLSTFLYPFITLLMEESMFRFMIDSEGDKVAKKRIISTSLIYIILGTVSFSILTAIITSIIKNVYGIYFIFFVISTILITVSNAVARGEGKIKLYSVSNFVLGAGTIILNVLFIVGFNWGIKGLILANIIANTVTSVIFFIVLKINKYISFKYINRSLLKEMVLYSIPLVPNNISWIIISLSDRLMLTWLAGADTNGIYSVANKFPNIIYTFYGFFSIAWKESAARIVKESNKEEYYVGICNDVKNFLKATVLGLIAIMPFVFPWLTDISYREGLLYIPILTLAIYYTNMSNFYGGIYIAFKKTKGMGIMTFVAAILNIILNFIFIPKYGIYAAAFSTLIANWLVYIYRRIDLKKYVNLKEGFNFLFWTLFVVTVGIYYTKMIKVQLIVFFVVLIYCIYINRKFIVEILKMLKLKK